MSKSVTVLMGGWSSEREVSLSSGANVARALGEQGYDVRLHDVKRDLGDLLAALTPRPDVVFNALHGRYGEDGCIQGVLEVLGIPYTHSGVMASALAMNKPMAKKLFVDAGLPCADGRVVHRDEFRRGEPMARPYVVKPLNEGSSVGVIIVRAGDNPPLAANQWPFGDEVLVERYVPGREITVAVMGDRALGATEIRMGEGFYDYGAKYTEGRATHLVPAPLPEARYREALDIALGAHNALGCRGVTRADMRYDDTGGGSGSFYLLEVNTQPGMTPMSLVPEIAASVDIGFGELVAWMVENAACGG
jgi:D-alanine-D-alanine ligase